MTLEIKNIFDSDGAEAVLARPQSVISDIKECINDKNRVNIYVDSKFFCSLDISQVVDFHLKIGLKIDDERKTELKRASEFGKFYLRALEYCLMRPHSSKEIRDYLKKKTLARKVRVKDAKTGEYKIVDKKGYDASLVGLVFDRLVVHGYIDDEKFARVWVENRNLRKGSSFKKLKNELITKGVSHQIIEQVLFESNRDEREELRKMIDKKRNKYSKEKLMNYLLRQGFSYSDVSEELSDMISSSDGI